MKFNIDYSGEVSVAKRTNTNVDHVDVLNDKRVVANFQQHRKGSSNCTPIQQFFRNQSIFITGGTGFLGKVLIEKLLRSCPEVSKIFVLIREKTDKKVNERTSDLLQDPVFAKSRSNSLNFESKIHGIAGDCSLDNLGLADDDAELLKREVTIVFHVAATVRFNEKLKKATAINIRSTSSVIALCRGMKQLKSFVHVSTAYANCFVADIDEKCYNYPIDHEQLLFLVDNLPEKTIDGITPQLIKPWPNTYTFTKALSEDLIRDECTSLPVAIFRPGIVTPSTWEPTPGWIDNYNGIVGVAAQVASGVLRVLRGNSKALANIVPVDLTINALIASAWDSTLRANRRADDDVPIYNFTSVNEAPITWGAVGRNMVKYARNYPLSSALWCATFRLAKHPVIYNLYFLLLHLIPAHFADVSMRIVGRKSRMTKLCRKIYQMDVAFGYFLLNSWRLRDGNVRDMWNRLGARDQRMFRFSMQDFDWDRYFDNCMKGIRVFMFHDDLGTLEASRKKYKRFVLIHKFMVPLFVVFASCILWKVFSSILFR